MTAPTLVCMMAKVPELGLVKTRLCPPLSAEQATALATAFVIDTWDGLGRIPGIERVLAYAGDPTRLPGSMAHEQLWPQVDGDLGARMEHVITRGLERCPRVIVIGSDAPGLPTMLIEEGCRYLEREDAVLGPAVDGGFYLIGTSRIHVGLLMGLPWSRPNTLSATYRRLRRCGYTVARLPVWFDVDDIDSLTLLERVLSSRTVRAPATRVCLSRLFA